MFYYLHKTSLTRGGSYIKSPKWLGNKRATINPKNKKDENIFQYALILALNHQIIERDHQGILKIKPFINQYNWKDIDFPSQQKDWKKFEKKNKRQLLLIYNLYHTILKKFGLHTNQNITMSAKIK